MSPTVYAGFSNYLLKYQPQLLPHKLASRVGTRARSGKATARIHGTGRRWRKVMSLTQFFPCFVSSFFLLLLRPDVLPSDALFYPQFPAVC